MAHDFIAHHPLSLKEVIITPMIFRENVQAFRDQPFPCIGLIRDLARFAGYGPGALRTAMSRLRASGELVGFDDESDVTRFRLSEARRAISDVVIGWETRPEGFIIGVFSFKKENEAERRFVRETLRHFRFKRIAQNTYISGMIDTAGLNAAMTRAGVAEHFYLFRCPTIDDPSLLLRLKQIFDVRGRARELAAFLQKLKAFLEEPGMDAMEFGRRLFYAGPVHHTKSFVEEPPLPAGLLPPGYPLPELRGYLRAAMAARSGDVLGYYRTLCGMKA
jgi:DNA-binding transcriptional regulator PaaX